MRRRYRELQNRFNVSLKLNEVCLPEYNALEDPYLVGYFDQKFVKKHLRQTGIIRPRKSKNIRSHTAKKELVQSNIQPENCQEVAQSRQKNEKKNPPEPHLKGRVRLAVLEEIMAPSVTRKHHSSSVPRSRVYKSRSQAI